MKKKTRAKETPKRSRLRQTKVEFLSTNKKELEITGEQAKSYLFDFCLRLWQRHNLTEWMAARAFEYISEMEYDGSIGDFTSYEHVIDDFCTHLEQLVDVDNARDSSRIVFP